MITTPVTLDKVIAWLLSGLKSTKFAPNTLIYTQRDIEVASASAMYYGEQCPTPTDPS